MSQQRYTYIGLAIVFASAAIVIYFGWRLMEFIFAPRPTVEAQMSDEEVALYTQCNERHGQFAITRSVPYSWYECYSDRKKLWGVRLTEGGKP